MIYRRSGNSAALSSSPGYRSPDSRGNTPPYCAIDTGDGKIVEQLLQARVNINAPSRGGLTPFMKATTEGHIEIVCALLESEADYRTYCKDGFTCAHYIAWTR
ncbi:ankyrin repeat-containing domain protein [Aspergillus carlsbadensis]|nr:ankyrin repeat-containing domain protein [Aspergillus carlsbadensis]